MKSKLALVTVILTVLAFAAPNVAFGTTAGAMEYGWQDKLYRGSMNIITSPLEITQGIGAHHEKDGIFAGLTIGFVDGLGKGVTRLGAGLVDLVTFAFPAPDKHNAPLVEPEYVDLKVF